jgi:hypothetical protein
MTIDATSQGELSAGNATSEEPRSSGRTSGVKTTAGASPPLAGELRRPPRSALWTFVLGATGLLVVGHLMAVVARLTLGIRRPASLEVTPSGIRLKQRTLLLGRVIRDRQTVVPLDALLRVTREVRFARSGLYAGLAMLALGTYFGIGLFVDGLRAPGSSPSLLFMGLVVMLLGLILDYGLSSLADTARGRCQVTVVPVRGRPLCVGALEPRHADAALRLVATELGIEPEHPEAESGQLLDQLGVLAEKATESFSAKTRVKRAAGSRDRTPSSGDLGTEQSPPPEASETAEAAHDEEPEDDVVETGRRAAEGAAETEATKVERGAEGKEHGGDPAQPPTDADAADSGESRRAEPRDDDERDDDERDDDERDDDERDDDERDDDERDASSRTENADSDGDDAPKPNEK